MRALILNDVHLADKPPSIRTNDYTDDIFAKLEFCVEKAKELKVDVIIQLGDLYHIKSPGRNSHALVQRTWDTFSKFDGETIIVPGNHDLVHDRLESLPRQPLGTLGKMPGITVLQGAHPKWPIFAIPFLYDWPALINGWMAKYTKWANEEKAKDLDHWPLLITHAPIFPDGEEPPYDYITASDWADLMEKGSCAYGHIHDPHGTWWISSVEFCNQGALSRGSLHEKTLKRKPAVTLYDTTPYETGKTPGTSHFTRVEVPHRPIEQVFKLAPKEDVDARNSRVATFLAGVEQTVVSGLSLEEVIAFAEAKKDLHPQTLEQLRSCVEEVASR